MKFESLPISWGISKHKADSDVLINTDAIMQFACC